MKSSTSGLWAWCASKLLIIPVCAADQKHCGMSQKVCLFYSILHFIMANMISLCSALQQVGNSAIFIHCMYIYIYAQINTVGGVVCKSSSIHMCNMRPIVLTIYFTQVGSKFTRAHKFKKAPELQFSDILNVLWVTDLTNIIWVQRDSVTHVPGSCFWWWRHITCNPLLRLGGRSSEIMLAKEKASNITCKEWMYFYCVWCEVRTLLNWAWYENLGHVWAENVDWFELSVKSPSISSSFTPYSPFQWYRQSKEILLNLCMKCWNSIFNAQGSRVIIVVVLVGAVNIYVTAVQALRKKETGWNSVYHQNWWKN